MPPLSRIGNSIPSAALDDLLVTGPTRTKVNDYRAIVVT